MKWRRRLIGCFIVDDTLITVAKPVKFTGGIRQQNNHHGNDGILQIPAVVFKINSEVKWYRT